MTPTPTPTRTPAVPTLAELRTARERIKGSAVRTPLLRVHAPEFAGELWVKLECLQPIGSFKIRGAANAMKSVPRETLARGVLTASAGNMAQGVAWCARELGVACHVVAPDHAPVTKLAAIERLGARVIRVPFERWWRVLEEHRYEGLDGLFLHPVSDPAVIAGNGTIALEILEELADVDTVVVPFGGGGLSSGIAAGVRALAPRTKVFACEVETAAPLAAALAAGSPQATPYTPSFVDGIGGRGVLSEMWPLASTLLDGSIVVTLVEIAGAIRLLAERQRVIAEGAGAASVAAALSGRAPGRRVVCVVSGGNIDFAKLATILGGGMP
jgi:threonine dehydratase